MANRIFRRVVNTVGVLALIAVVGVVALLGSLWLDHSRSTTLPTPTGPYKVGRSTYAWTDETRINPFAPAPNTRQELGIWMWYPAAPTPSAKPSEYLPPYWRRALEQHNGFVLSKLLSRDLARIKTHSWADANVSLEQSSYPVVILRAGGGALSTDYTSLAEDLASHGYVVLSLDAPYRTVVMPFPDGRVIIRSGRDNVESMPRAEAERFANKLMVAWIGDMKFVLDKLQQLNNNDPTGRFKGKLNMQEIGIAGHSLGGATAAQFCHDDDRCKAGIDIDGMPFGNVIQQGLHQPFFFIMSDHSKEPGAEARSVKSDIESIYNATPEGERWQVTIVGANHFSFSDQMLTKSSIFVSILQRLGMFGRLEKRRGLAVTSACVDTFFDVYLKGAPSNELGNLPTLYPEVKPGITDAFPPGD
jgi:predicted dienelactone hydrolase